MKQWIKWQMMMITVASAGTLHAAIYDFENLNAGNLGTQDNWDVLVGNPQITGPLGLGNTSSRAFQSTGPNAVEVYATRINDGNFGFAPASATETNAILQFDVRLGSGAFVRQGSVGLGHDADGDGKIEFRPSPFEINAVLGVYDLNDGNGVRLFLAKGSGSGIGAIVLGIAAPSGMTTNDWLRTRLVMDLTKNGGDGEGDVYMMNLTGGDTSFTPVAGLQNINMSFLAGPAPTSWDGIYVEAVGNPNSGQIDNIFVDVPEPTTAALLGLAGLWLVRRRRSAERNS